MKFSTLKRRPRYSKLPDAFYSQVKPEPAPNAVWVAFNRGLAEELGLDADANTTDASLLEALRGGALSEGDTPIAEVYAGHQFGSYVPRLGDGRAILLAEIEGRDGIVRDLQLKGAGKTPYSRFGDGRAVLRSCIREYLASEAMHALGIPTSRALAVVGSDEKVQRETIETRALLLRVAPSHLRFGTFEYFYYRKEHDRIRELIEYAIRNHFPEHQAQLSADGVTPDLVEALLRTVVRSTAQLMAAWQSVGFEHGVMNTDNFSLLGLTIDYGPYGFMDDYDPSWICNHSDEMGRYAFDQQPAIGLWNLKCLAQTWVPWLGTIVQEDGEPEWKVRAFRALEVYDGEFHSEFLLRMRTKFGLETVGTPTESEILEDGAIMRDGLEALQKSRGDYTLFFRRLAAVNPNSDWDSAEVLALRVIAREADVLRPWLTRYQQRIQRDTRAPGERARLMNAVNPKYVLRNYLAQKAIESAEKGGFAETEKLHRVLTRPFDDQPELEAYAQPTPEWGKRLEISCSS